MSMQMPGQSPDKTPRTIVHVDAFETTQAERDALAEEDCIVVFADSLATSTTVLGVVEQTAEYEAELTVHLGPGVRDRASKCALAASHAQQLYLISEDPPEDLGPLMEEVKAARTLLLHDAEGLVLRKLVGAEQLAKLSGSLAYRSIAYDVMMLCNLFRGAWPEVADKTGLSLDEVDDAHRLAEKAEQALAVREGKEKKRAAANLERQRAFTLMVRAYDQLRRGLTFILWGKGTLEQIAPSLHNRPRAAGSSKDDPESDVPAANGAASGAAAMNEAPILANGASPPTNGTAEPALPKPGTPDSPFLT